MNKRLVHYDLLRIFAAYLIVMLHLSVQYIHQAPPSFQEYDQWKYNIAFSAFSRIGVPIFIMLSGLFLLNPEKKVTISMVFTKYLSKIFLLFIFWSFFYAFAEQDFYRHFWESGFHFQPCWNAMDHPHFWHSVLKGNYHMWYLYMLAGLYLITPLVRILAAHASQHQFWYFMVLCMLITFVTKFNDTLWKVKELSDVLDTMALTLPFGYVGYYLAGYFLDKLLGDSLLVRNLVCLKQPLQLAVKSPKDYFSGTLKFILNGLDKRAIIIYILGIAAFVFTVFWTIQKNPMFGFRVPELILFSNYSPTILLMSFGIFTLTARLKQLRLPRFLRVLAKRLPQYMLLVYMIHPFIITEFRREGLLVNSRIAGSLPLNAFSVFLFSLMISIVLLQIYKLIGRLARKLFI